MTIYEDIKNTIVKLMKVKRMPGAKVEGCNATINVFKSVKSKAEAMAKERKVEIDNNIIFEAINKELKELRQTVETTPESSDQNAMAKLQISAIEPYTPVQLTMEELKETLEKMVKNENFSNFGQAMKFANSELKNVANGKDIANILKSIMN